MKKAFLLAAVACAAMFALPAMASAGVWHVQNGTIGFSGEGGPGELTLTSGEPIKCTSAVVKGAYETTTTGWVEFDFGGCKTSFFNCATSPHTDASQTITTTKLTFHNVLAVGNVPAILITGGPGPKEGEKRHFATFRCFGISIAVTGNGIIGRLNKNCGEKTPNAIATFASSAAGVPNPTRITGLGTEYTLESSTAGGAPVMASEDALVTLNFAGEAEQTIQCTGV